MIKAIFIAPSYQQAEYWANQWGYRSREWRYINNCVPQHTYGYWNPDVPAFSCGDREPSNPMWRELEMRGFTVYDAESLAC